jgi:23S rRNA pseudouridine2605 synthase
MPPLKQLKQPKQPKRSKKPTRKPTKPTRPPRPEPGRRPSPAGGKAAPAAGSRTTAPERLNRYLARCGLCSRREADRWIAAGRVSINGDAVTALGTLVGPRDAVAVDGRPVSPVTELTYLVYHKPRGLLCSRKDAERRPLIYDELDVAANVQSVGRLDMDSEGLLLLTDDGDLAQKLAHPSSHIPRTYRVRVGGRVELGTLERLRRGGIDLGDGETSDPWQVSVDAESGGHTWLAVVLHRGRWREVRRTLEACGHPVRRLIRTHFGPVSLEDQPRGAVRPMRARELRALRNMIAQGRKKAAP